MRWIRKEGLIADPLLPTSGRIHPLGFDGSSHRAGRETQRGWPPTILDASERHLESSTRARRWSTKKSEPLVQQGVSVVAFVVKYKPNEWIRASRGRSARFDVSVDHLIAALTHLEDKAKIKSAWQVIAVGSQHVRGAKGRQYEQVTRILALKYLPKLLSDGLTHMYLFDRDITTLGGVDIRSDVQAWCGMNGLVIMTFLSNESAGWDVLLSLTNKIQHSQTGERVDHVEQSRLFDELCRLLKADPATIAPPAKPVKRPGRRLKPGDVYAIRLNPDSEPADFVFVHLLKIHTDPPRFGPFIRVFKQRSNQPTIDLAKIDSREQFRTFFPLGYAERAGLADYVGSLDVPPVDQVWPAFKNFNYNPDTGVRTWFVRERGGVNNSTKFGPHLPAELHDAPWPGVINHTLLVKYVLTGWTHHTDLRPQDLMA